MRGSSYSSVYARHYIANLARYQRLGTNRTGARSNAEREGSSVPFSLPRKPVTSGRKLFAIILSDIGDKSVSPFLVHSLFGEPTMANRGADS